MLSSKRLMIIGLTLLVLAIVGLVLLTMRAKPSNGSHHTPLFFLIPTYTALIPIYIAAWRRRRNNNNV